MTILGAFGGFHRMNAGGPSPLRALVLAFGLGLASFSTPAAALDDVTLSAPGASDDLLRALRASSLVLAARDEQRTAPVDLMAAARAEYGRLIGLMYEHGYYAPTISVRVDGREASAISPLRNPAQVDRIDVAISLGPLFTFAQTAITPLAPGTQLPNGFAVGQPARSTLIRDAARAAVRGWQEQGHAQARTDGQEVVANHTTNTLSVRLRIAPGSRLSFGQTIAQGNERTRDDRVRAIAGLPQGQVFNPDALQDAADRLRRTGTFTSVVVEPAEQANPDGSINTVVELTEAPLRRIGFGAEIDSAAGGTVSGFWLHRNLLGGAERFRVEASVDGIAAQTGGIGYALALSYVRPATTRSTADLEIDLRAARQTELDYDADVIEGQATLVRRFGDTLTVEAGLALRAESAEYGRLRGRLGRYGTLGFVLGVERDTRDNPLNATEGTFGALTLMPYAGFGRADSGVRLHFDSRAYHDLGTEGRVVLAGRFQGGAIIGSDLNDTPRGFLFYSGGGGTVRGLPYQSLGASGVVTESGGLGFAALSTELRVQATDSLSIVGFADAGRVSTGAFSGASDWHAGAGFGVRYDTPVGPLRLDIATPLRRNATAAGSQSVQLYLGLGQAF